MSYTPVELRHVSVRRRLLGYDPRSVQQILDDVADSFETVWSDRGELADRVEELEGEVEELKGREHTLSNTLLAAERAANELREQAKREAEVILTEARGEARSVLRDARDERERLLVDTRRIETLLRSALAIVGESHRRPVGEPSKPLAAREAVAAPGVGDAAAAPEPVVEGGSPGPEPATEAELVATAPPAADAEAEYDDTPGWPPLRQVAQGSSRFDWGE
jgi:cell division initiation protein